MQATLSVEDKAFLSNLSDEDQELNLGGVYKLLERITCGLDFCEFMSKRIQETYSEADLMFENERSKPIPTVVFQSFIHMKELLEKYAEIHVYLQGELKHYSELERILKEKEIIERLNRES